MKRILWGLTAGVSFFLCSVGVVAGAEVGLLDQRVREAHLAVDKMMSAPDQSIPEELLAKCKAVAIYPSVLKGGFVFGARFGQGVVLKRDEQTGAWGPAAFSTIGGGSWGVQIGVQASDLVLVIMNDRGLEGFLSSRFVLGTDASVAAGPVGRDTQVATDLFLQSGILSYSRSRGLFAGVVLDGSLVTQDNDSNSKYYGKKVTSRDILNGHAVDFHPAAKALAGALDEYSSRWDKRIVKK